MKILLSLFIIALFAVEVHGANPAFTDFNTNQFSTTGNKIAIKSGASVTNLTNNGSAVATMSTLVWTNESSVYRIIGFPQADTNNYVVHDLSTAGSARTTLNAGTSGVGFVKWNTEMNAISAGETYGISEFIANDSTDEWSARLNIGTNAAANTEYLQFSLEKSSRGALAVLNPGSISSEDEDNIYLFDTLTSQTNANDVLMSVRNFGTNEFQVDRLGAISLSAETNKLSIANDQLLLDDVPISGGTETAPVNNFYATNIFYQSGKGNTLIITQQLTLNYMPTNILATDGSGGVTNAVIGSGLTWTPSTRTLTASGDTTFSNVVTLTQTGTNISQLDFSLVQNGGVFKLSLTNNGYIGAPANVATSPFRKAWLIVQQPSTGTCILQFTNGHFAWPERVSPVVDTNNGSVAVFQFVTDVFSNIVHGSMVPWSGLATNM